MALYGILGNIHGNLEALKAVLAVFDSQRIRHILCVGDVVGYNADPDACVALLRSRGAQVIAGRYDLIGTRLLGFQHCPNKLRYAIKRTRAVLQPETAAWLKALPQNHVVEGSIGIVQRQQDAADVPGARVCFFGESPQPKVCDATGDEVREFTPQSFTRLDPERRYFIHAGSVDAQRKAGQRLAEFAVFDSTAMTVEFLRTRYDAASTEAKAAVFGYRITPFTDSLYTLRRRLVLAPQVAWTLCRRVGALLRIKPLRTAGA
ncbi:MAG TPA: metallophosphoesterase family protein [Burkholderiales bacterium]|nr:metallophosphoesterase family protein [Burkholderiales bacterium]